MKVAVKCLQIAIDGPSASGKGTIARQLAEILQLPVLDTGLLYRFAGWQALLAGLSEAHPEQLLARLQETLPLIRWDADGLFFSGKDCTSTLRGEDVGIMASRVSALPTVRASLLDIQQQLASRGCVMDGRDIGTVVLPKAQAKFFLTASLRERARRRWLQLDDEQQRHTNLETLAEEMTARDERDSKRNHAPLQRAPDAIVVDSTTMRQDEVLDRMVQILHRRKLIQ